MSDDHAISVENLGKRYQLGGAAPADTLRDAVSHGLSGAWARLRKRPDPTTDFWALRDLSFSVPCGQTCGVVGRNGAGKSTLLKLLSRITEPTTGRITLRGRVASLLEVGTGFHPELTGRENIYLNGAILGMSRAEIRKKFDEIVAFAEVERFLDTPVKRYSSGMYVRLAFAVAAHLEPEILIVDEVLAVGDAEFQRRCLGKMRSVASSGRTVFFVSHNLASVRSLCTSALLLDEGRLVTQGTSDAVTEEYLRRTRGGDSGATIWRPSTTANVDEPAVAAAHLHPGTDIERGQPLEIVVELTGPSRPDLVVTVKIKDEWDRVILHSSDEFAPTRLQASHRAMVLDSALLNLGEYSIDIGLSVRNLKIFSRNEQVLRFRISDPAFSVAGTSAENWQGILSPRLPRWETRTP
jgi:lipopolysaccharide transport system ATP-binding protein